MKWSARLVFLSLVAPIGLQAQPKISFERDRVRPLDLVQILSPEGAEEARRRIATLAVIVAHETDHGQIVKVRLSRAKTYIQLSRRARAAAGTLQAAAVRSDEDLKKAQDDLNAISELKNLSDIEQSYLYYLRGLVALDLASYDQGIDFLNRAIALNPNAEYAVDLALFLGDEAYFNEHFSEALVHYSRLLNKMPLKSQLRTLYRIAWIDILGGKLDKAESELVSLATRKPADLRQSSLGEDFRQDILRDLAELEAKAKPDAEIVALVKTQLKLSANEESAFLHDVQQFRLDSGDNKSSSVLLSRSLKLAGSGIARIELRLRHLQLRLPDAFGDDPEISMDGLITEYLALSPADKRNVVTQFGTEIQSEIEYAINHEAARYAKLSANTKDVSIRHLVAERLVRQLSVIESDFHAKSRLNNLRLWLEICASDQKWTCVVEVSDRILRDKELQAVAERALMDRISAYEELSKAQPKENLPRLKDALVQYLAEPKRKEWLTVAKRLGSFYVREKNLTEARVLFLQIDVREKSEDSFYRLQLCRFEEGLFDELLQDSRPKFKSERIDNLIKESHLRLAQKQSGEDGEFAVYQANLKKYLAMTSDPTKKAALLKDYFQRLEGRRADDDLLVELLKLDVRQRFDPDFEGLSRRLIVALFLKGKYAQVESLISPAKSGSPRDLLLTSVLAQLARGAKVRVTPLNEMTEDNQVYVLGLLALSDPAQVDVYLRAHRNASRAAREAGFLAAKIQSCDLVFNPSAEQLKRLGDAVPVALRPQAVTALEKRMEAVPLTAPKKMTSTSSDKMMRALESVRAIRAMIAKELPMQSNPVQLRILAKAEALERQAARLITGAPLPGGLTVTQQSEYRAQVSGLAQEFLAQADQFASAAKGKERSRLPVNKLADREKWPWSNSNLLENLRQRDKAASTLSALIDVEFAHSAGLKIPEDDYWRERAGLLLSKIPCQSMVDYVYHELANVKQNKLLEQWSRL